MSLFRGKRILIGISASIAAYKSAFLVREFIKKGAQVQVIMTPESTKFVTPLTLSTLSKNPVLFSLVKEDNEHLWNNHVDIGQWADMMVIAPATANTLSKMAHGECDNLLLTTYMSAKCPVYFAPAMDLDMLKHHSTQKNIEKLVSFGNIYVPVQEGELASGLYGKGRMAEPHDIISFIENDCYKKMPLYHKSILVTAGPTYESIDPIRFIGNHSSGKMGYAIAEEAANQGANVVLISGPTHLEVSHSNIQLIRLESADEMHQACLQHFEKVDVAIMSAAVSDFKPDTKRHEKIKKTDTNFKLNLVKTPDILHQLGQIKTNQILVGFALETNNEIDHAKNKLKNKQLDFIVLNSLNDKGAGFKTDTNKITIIDNHNKLYNFELKSKNEVAKDIINHLTKHLNDI